MYCLYFVILLHLYNFLEEVDVLDGNVQQLSSAHLVPVSERKITVLSNLSLHQWGGCIIL